MNVLCTSSCNTAIIVVIPRKPRRVICACALRNCSNRVQTKENKTSGAVEMKEVISFLSFIIELRYQKKKKKNSPEPGREYSVILLVELKIRLQKRFSAFCRLISLEKRPVYYVLTDVSCTKGPACLDFKIIPYPRYYFSDLKYKSF